MRMTTNGLIASPLPASTKKPRSPHRVDRGFVCVVLTCGHILAIVPMAVALFGAGGYDDRPGEQPLNQDHCDLRQGGMATGTAAIDLGFTGGVVPQPSGNSGRLAGLGSPAQIVAG
jgi:hypothetical protein